MHHGLDLGKRRLVELLDCALSSKRFLMHHALSLEKCRLDGLWRMKMWM